MVYKNVLNSLYFSLKYDNFNHVSIFIQAKQLFIENTDWMLSTIKFNCC